MKETDWSGNPPENPMMARQRLIESALACAKRCGISKTNIKRVADEAGVTRQTVYRYFPSTNDLVLAVSVQVAGDILNRLLLHVEKHDRFDARAVESIVFLARAIPNDPLLSQYFSAEQANSINIADAFAEEGIEYGYEILKRMYSEKPVSTAEEKWLKGLAEHMQRLLLSLVLAPSKQTRTDKGMRSYLDTWLRPLLVKN